MAIIDSFEVRVLVDQQPCPEYPDHESDNGGHSRSTYIETNPNVHFSVQLEIMPGFHFGRANYLRWEIFLDGNSVTKPLCYRRDYDRDQYWIDARGSLREQQRGRWFEKKFYFGNASIRDTKPGDSEQTNRELSKILGTIRVVIRRRVGGPKRDLQREPAQFRGEVPEKAVRPQAVTLAPRLGAAEVSEGITYNEGEDVDAEPVAEFVFKYRTKEALKQLLIIPTTPEPEPLEERPLGEYTLEEAIEVIRRQRERQVKIEREIQERDLEARRHDREATIDNDDEVEFVSSGPVRKKSQPTEEDVVVDLSD